MQPRVGQQADADLLALVEARVRVVGHSHVHPGTVPHGATGQALIYRR